eukprot:1196316-Prorocentrum_minimum.AAC.5
MYLLSLPGEQLRMEKTCRFALPSPSFKRCVGHHRKVHQRSHPMRMRRIQATLETPSKELTALKVREGG